MLNRSSVLSLKAVLNRRRTTVGPPSRRVSRATSTVNPLRIDPTRTITLRRRLGEEFKRRFARLKMALYKLVVEDDAFGLKEESHDPWNLASNLASFTANTRWKFSDDPDKVASFKVWLKTQVEVQLLSQSDKELWQRYVEQGFAKGAGRSFDDVKARHPAAMAETLDFTGGRREQFLRDAFGQPVAIEKVKLLAGRLYDDLDGVTKQMSTVMARTLTDGLVQGKSPRAIARDLSDNVDKIGKDRALLIAHTEIIRAHAEGQLLALRQLGVEEVGVMVEWSTTGDAKVCPQCKPMEGVVLTLDEATGLIPRHPRCRCAWIPAAVGEKTKGQKRGKKQVAKAADKAGLSIELDIGGRKATVNQWVPLTNAFCPTGKGGGVDPTCSPVTAEKSAKRLAEERKQLQAEERKRKKVQSPSSPPSVVSHAITGIVDQLPRGATASLLDFKQLHDQLKVKGVNATIPELHAALDELSKEGKVRLVPATRAEALVEAGDYLMRIQGEPHFHVAPVANEWTPIRSTFLHA